MRARPQQQHVRTDILIALRRPVTNRQLPGDRLQLRTAHDSPFAQQHGRQQQACETGAALLPGHAVLQPGDAGGRQKPGEGGCSSRSASLQMPGGRLCRLPLPWPHDAVALQVCLGLPHTPTEHVHVADNKQLPLAADFKVGCCCARPQRCCSSCRPLTAAAATRHSLCAWATRSTSQQRGAAAAAHRAAAAVAAAACCHTARAWRWGSAAACTRVWPARAHVARMQHETVADAHLSPLLRAGRPRHTS